MANVAAIVLHYRMPELTRRVVEDIMKQGCVPDVYVVDNGSPESLVSDDSRVTVMRSETNLFFSGGFNWGVERVLQRHAYDYLWLVTQDVRLPEMCLERLLYNIKEFQPCAIVSACVSVDTDGNIPQMLPRRVASVRPVRWLEWIAPLVPVLAWREVGPLDERMHFGGMDADWCYRAVQSGYDCLVDYSVMMRHRHLTVFRSFKEEDARNPVLQRQIADEAVLREKWGINWYEKLCPEVGAWWYNWQRMRGIRRTR